MESNFTIEQLFSQSPKNPFHYNVTLEGINENSKPSAVFENIKNIFIKGLVIVTDGNALNKDNKSVIDIDKLEESDFKKIRERLLSIGIEAKYKIYDENDKDYYLRGMLYDLEKDKNINLSVNIDWRSQLINTVEIKLKKEKANDLYKKLEKHPEANYFMNINPPKNLKDFTIRFTKETENKLHVIYFDVAKQTDYHYHHKYFDNFDKHVR